MIKHLNKRAVYIALITGIFLILLEMIGLGRYAFIAFVAFPIFFSQEVNFQSPHSVLKVFLDNFFSILTGAGMAWVCIFGGVNFIVGTALVVFATYIASEQKIFPAAMIFGTMGMMFATGGNLSVVIGMMTAGMGLCGLARIPFTWIKE